MSRAEDVAYARNLARRTAARDLWRERNEQVPLWQALDAVAERSAHTAAVHLADSTGDDLALVWAREYAKVYRTLADSSRRALQRHHNSAKAVL